MENVDYIGNGNRQIKKYREAIDSLNSAIRTYEEARNELNAIVGVPPCDTLKMDLENKIKELQNKIKDINTVIFSIKSKAKNLDKEQKEQQSIQERSF